MAKTPSRANRVAQPGSRFASEVVADHVRVLRRARSLSQDELAAAMSELGHSTWSRATVSEVERYFRAVAIDELVSLAVVLRQPPSKLLDPSTLIGLDGDWLSGIDFGGRTPVPSELVSYWASGELTVGQSPDGGLWLDAHSPSAHEAAAEAIATQQAVIEMYSRRASNGQSGERTPRPRKSK